jgi:hypothetical protein
VDAPLGWSILDITTQIYLFQIGNLKENCKYIYVPLSSFVGVGDSAEVYAVNCVKMIGARYKDYD